MAFVSILKLNYMKPESKWMLRKQHGVVWTGLIWLTLGTSGVLVNTVMNIRVPYKGSKVLE
jgi:hypothetical protein